MKFSTSASLIFVAALLALPSLANSAPVKPQVEARHLSNAVELEAREYAQAFGELFSRREIELLDEIFARVPLGSHTLGMGHGGIKRVLGAAMKMAVTQASQEFEHPQSTY